MPASLGSANQESQMKKNTFSAVRKSVMLCEKCQINKKLWYEMTLFLSAEK